MDFRYKKQLSALAFVAYSILGNMAHATIVYPSGSLTDLGLFMAGTYDITGSGIVDLTGDGQFKMQPNGLPESTVTYPGYGYFNPNGSSIADSSYGPAGTNALLGALIGTLSKAPSNTSDWFQIGYLTKVTLTASGHIYASVNDTSYNNDTGSFMVNVAVVSAVPEPTSIALLTTGLLGLAVSCRKNNRT